MTLLATAEKTPAGTAAAAIVATGDAKAPRHQAAAGQPLRIVPALNSSSPIGGTPIAGPAQPNPIAVFIDLEIEARACVTLGELKHSIANASRKLIPFDQAFLIEPINGAGNWRVSTASSVSSVDPHAPAVRFIAAWANHPKRPRDIFGGTPVARSMAEDASAWGLDGAECRFAAALVVPIRDRAGLTRGVLIALSQHPWLPQSGQLMAPLAGAYAHAWAALEPKTQTLLPLVIRQLKASRLAISGMVLAAIVGFVPVPLTALAPSEVVAAEPTVVAAPIDGVVKDIMAAPGARVDKGETILRFVDVKLRNDAEVAGRAKLVAEAKYFKALQSAVSNQKDMQDISITKAELAVAEAEATYAREMLARTEIKAERAGVLLYSAKSDLVGKPVSIGERMMEIADPTKLELRIDVPMSDAIALTPGADVKLFLDGEPTKSVTAKIERVGYRPVTTADHQLVIRVFARFTETPPRQIGLRGTARLAGEDVSLAFYLFRRPISVLRQKIGL